MFGLLDPTVLLLGAMDPLTGTIYIYDEYVKNRVSVGTHAAEMKRRLAHIPLGSLLKLMGDPSGAKRNINDLKSTFNHYQEHGIYFQKGNNRIEQGIMKVFSYLEMGKLKILSHLKTIVSEGEKYMYKPVELGEKQEEKPIDVDNHTMDALRYLIAELPDDPNTLGRDGMNASSDREHNNIVNERLPWELQEEETLEYNQDSWYNNY